MGTFGVRSSRSLLCRLSVVSTALLVIFGLSVSGGGPAVAVAAAKSPAQSITGTVHTVIREQRVHKDRGASDTAKVLKVGNKFVPLTVDSLTTVKDGTRVTVTVAPTTSATKNVLTSATVLAARGAAGMTGTTSFAMAADGDPAPAAAVHEVYIALVLPAGVEADTTTTEAVARATVAEASAFWSSQTDGKVAFVTAQVLPTYQSAVGCSDPYGMWDEAAGMMPGSVGPNKHLVVLSPSTSTDPACPYAGFSTVGGSVGEGGNVYVSVLEPQVIAHELGHNMGRLHSNSLVCDNAQDGAWTGEVFAGCTPKDYDDLFDVMGFGGFGGLHVGMGSLNPVHLEGMGLVPDAIRRIPANSGTTTVTIPPLSSATNVDRALKIADSSGEDYFVEYRTNAGIDAFIGNYYADPGWGVRVLRSNPENPANVGWQPYMASYVMDYSPAGSGLSRAIPVGGTFTSASTKLTIKVTAQTAAGATLSITNGEKLVPATASMTIPSSATIGTPIIASTLVLDQFGSPLLGWPVSLQKMQKGTTTWQSAQPAGWPSFNTDTSTGMLAVSFPAGLSASYRWVVQPVSGSVVKYSPTGVSASTAVVTGVPPVATLARRKSLTVIATIPAVPSPVVYLQYRYGTAAWITGPRASVSGTAATAKMTANSSGTLSTRMYLRSGVAYEGSYGAVFTTEVK